MSLTSFRSRAIAALQTLSIGIALFACQTPQVHGDDGTDAADVAVTDAIDVAIHDANPADHPPLFDAGNCEDAGVCHAGTVCCTMPLACAGRCVPDCRIDGGPGCPAMSPVCNPTTGLCMTARNDGGLLDAGPIDAALPPFDGGTCGDGGSCGPGRVCCTAPRTCAGRCVTDCRVDGGACPTMAPVCDPLTGLCSP